MHVVYDPRHVLQDPTTEVQYGVAMPMYEVPARVESIRAALLTDDSFSFTDPSATALSRCWRSTTRAWSASSARPRITEHAAAALVVSLGLDTYGQDPIADFALSTDVYHEVGRREAGLGLTTLVLQEGTSSPSSARTPGPGCAACWAARLTCARCRAERQHAGRNGTYGLPGEHRRCDGPPAVGGLRPHRDDAELSTEVYWLLS
jgi:hypothetical protein